MHKTPLYEIHQQLGARIVDFGGWLLPVQYSGIQAEHEAIRKRVGIFDVSHMGEVIVEGPDAEAFINKIITNDVGRLVNGQALYTVMCYPGGGIVDDLIIYKRNPQKYFICVNASNTNKDFAWFLKNREQEDVRIENHSAQYCQIAIQGPLAEKSLQKICQTNLKQISYFHFVDTTIQGANALIARTGYTGEDGFEIYLPTTHGPAIWKALLEAGKNDGLLPCGLGARDTLRLEASLALYGNDIDENTNPLEAGLGWVVKFQKTNFMGKEALEKIKRDGIKKKLVGIRMLERVIPRHHYEIFTSDQKQRIGEVRSGTLSPTLEIPIAMAYLDSGFSAEGNRVSIKIRDKFYPGEVTKMPFYRRKKEE